MDVPSMLKQLIGGGSEEKNCTVSNPIQPTDNVGEFGTTTDIKIKTTEEGGIEIDSKEMAIKLSKTLFDAVASFINKGE